MTLQQVSSFTRAVCDSLPIYQRESAGYRIFYTPGYLVLVESNQSGVFAQDLADSQQTGFLEARELRSRAARLQKTWDEKFFRPFSPLCLTLYLHNNCNLSCTYCFSTADPFGGKKLSLVEVQPAAGMVARNCRDQGQPFTVVFHGGGEPTLDRSQVDQILDFIEELARKHDLELFTYIATNGVMTAEKAAWMARRFNLVGISCDGPEDIQARQRPSAGNHSRSPNSNMTGIIERTARIVRETGKPLHVRTTITPLTVRRQSEIVDYICRQLKPVEIHLEPVYRGGRAGDEDCFHPSMAYEFVDGYLEARSLAAGFGVKLTTSGSRPGEIHGPYCHIFRDVLNLLPGGAATACFKITNAEADTARQLIIGQVDPLKSSFVVNDDHIQQLRGQALAFPTGCQECFNRYHCAGLCPHLCLISDHNGPGDDADNSFRCQAQKYLSERLIDEIAVRLWLSTSHKGICSCQATVV